MGLDVFNTNLFQLNIPLGKAIFPNYSNPVVYNTTGVERDQQGRIKRNTIIKELENLGIYDEEEDKAPNFPNKNFYEEK